MAVHLHDVHLADRRELARRLIIGEIVPLERRRGRLLGIHGIAQVFLHLLRLSGELFLRLRGLVLPLCAALVLDEIEAVHARVARSPISHRSRQEHPCRHHPKT